MKPTNGPRWCRRTRTGHPSVAPVARRQQCRRRSGHGDGANHIRDGRGRAERTGDQRGQAEDAAADGDVDDRRREAERADGAQEGSPVVCAAGESEADTTRSLTFASSRIHRVLCRGHARPLGYLAGHLSDTPAIPGDTPVLAAMGCRIGDGSPVNVSAMAMSPHVGAHADAPLHYGADAPAIGAVDLDPFLGRCRVIHAIDRGPLVTPAHLDHARQRSAGERPDADMREGANSVVPPTSRHLRRTRSPGSRR